MIAPFGNFYGSLLISSVSFPVFHAGVGTTRLGSDIRGQSCLYSGYLVVSGLRARAGNILAKVLFYFGSDFGA